MLQLTKASASAIRYSLRFQAYLHRTDQGTLIDVTEVAVIAASVEAGEKAVRELLGQHLGERHLRLAGAIQLEESSECGGS